MKHFLQKIQFKCLQTIYFNQVNKIIGCIPPWMSNNKENWCSSLENLTSRQADAVYSFFNKFTHAKVTQTDCLRPCTSVR